MLKEICGPPELASVRFRDVISKEVVQGGGRFREVLHLETPLHVAARSQHLELCRWLLSSDFSREFDFSFSVSVLHWISGSAFRFNLDFMLSCLRSCLSSSEKVNLKIVKLLVNHMRTKKGRHRANYFIEFGGVEKKTSVPYLCLNADVISYLLKCSLEFVKSREPFLHDHDHEFRSRRALEVALIRIIENPSDQFCAERVGDTLMEILRENGIHNNNNTSASATPLLCSLGGDSHPTWRFGVRYLEVAMASRWIPETWKTLQQCIMQDSRWVKIDARVLDRWLRRLDVSELDWKTAADLAVIILYSRCMFSMGPNPISPASPANHLIRIIEDHPDFSSILEKVLSVAADSKYHDPIMTAFFLRHCRKDQNMAVRILSGANGSVAASAFYQLAPLHRKYLATPQIVGLMIERGSNQLVNVIVWESNATLTQILFAYANPNRLRASGWHLRPKIACIREMYNLRMLLKPRMKAPVPHHFSEITQQHKFRPFPFLPSRAVLCILSVGWFGEML